MQVWSKRVKGFWNTSRTNKLVAVGAAVVVVVAGAAVVTSRASSFFTSTETENGALSTNAVLVTDSTASGGKAVQFTAPAAPPPSGGGGGGSTSCAVATLHVPDGPDGSGGCWPGPNNTGVPPGTTLTPYTGPCTITTANVVIDSKTINCDIVVASGASGLIIKNSQVNGSVGQPGDLGEANYSNASFTVQDSIVDGTVHGTGTGHDGYACTNCGVGNRNFTLLRVEVIHTNRGAYCEEVCHITDSYIHGQNLWPNDPGHPHASAVRQEHYADVEHSTLACDYKGPFIADIGCSADLTGYADFTYVWHNTINHNLFIEANGAASFCAYGGGTGGKPYSGDARNATYQVFTNNIFQRGANNICGDDGGPITDYLTGRTGNTWSGNKWSDGPAVSAN
jgi:hypothetical protein